jgi:hypothetical protein
MMWLLPMLAVKLKEQAEPKINLFLSCWASPRVAFASGWVPKEVSTVPRMLKLKGLTFARRPTVPLAQLEIVQATVTAGCNEASMLTSMLTSSSYRRLVGLDGKSQARHPSQ